jgi:hypothetical protein
MSTLHAICHSTWLTHQVCFLAATLIHGLYKPALSDNKEKPGRFVHWEQTVRHFIIIQGLDSLRAPEL